MIQRERYMQQIRDFMDKPVIKIITGMRRSGKSALLELTQQELLGRGISEKNIISINFESLRYEALKDYKALYAEISSKAEQASGRVYILLDEIQEVTAWEQVVNSLRVDFDCDIYVTGSNARLLSGWRHCLRGGMWRSAFIRWISRSTWILRLPTRMRPISPSRNSLRTFSGLGAYRAFTR